MPPTSLCSRGIGSRSGQRSQPCFSARKRPSGCTAQHSRSSTMRNVFLALTLTLATIACSTNPATGKRTFNIVSESQEISIGQQSHQEIIKQFGVYDEKPELNRLVDQIGHRIAATS